MKRLLLSIIILGAFFSNVCAQETSKDKKDPKRLQSKSYIFSGKLDRTIPWVGQKAGAIRRGYNVKRPAPSIALGWGPRGGTTLHGTQVSQDGIKALSTHKNAFHDTESFISQCADYLHLADNYPPTDIDGSSWTAIHGLDTGASAFFAETINDYWVGAATGTSPFIWSGGTEYARHFLVKHDSAVSSYTDGTERVSDTRDDTYVLFVEDSGEKAYVGSPIRLDGIHVELSGNTNILAAAFYVNAFRNGSFTAVTSLSDGTADGSGVTTLYESEGDITWTFDSSDDPYLLPENQKHMFWYEVGVDADISDGIKIKRLTVYADCQEMTNLWSGYYENVASCLLSSATGYEDFTGEVTDGTQVYYVDLNGQSELYIGSPYPIFAIYFYIDPDYGNVQDNVFLKEIYTWDGDNREWDAVSGTTHDSTSTENTYSMNHPGIIQWDGTEVKEDKMRLGGGIAAGLAPIYYYRLQWSEAFTASVRSYELSVAQKPESIPPMPQYSGFIEHAGRAFAWPGYKFKHGMDYAQEGDPFVWNGPKAGSTGDIFGPGIVNGATRLSSYVIVSTRDPYRLYIMQGKVPGAFDELLLSSQVGAVAPHTLITIEDAIKLFSSNLVYNSVFLMAPDAFYLVDGKKPINISQPISDYFDTNEAPYIEPAYAHLSYSWIDYQNRVVLTAAPVNFTGTGTQTTCNVVFPYSYVNDEWFDIWVFANPPACGISLVGNNDQRIPYMGDYSGYVWRGNYGDTDHGTRIEHYVKTPDFILQRDSMPDALNREAILRSVKTKTKTDTVGAIEIQSYPEGATSGVTPSGAMSLVRSGYDYTKGRVNCNERAESFAIRFRAGHRAGDEGAEMEIYGFTCDYQDIRDTQGQ